MKKKIYKKKGKPNPKNPSLSQTQPSQEKSLPPPAWNIFIPNTAQPRKVAASSGLEFFLCTVAPPSYPSAPIAFGLIPGHLIFSSSRHPHYHLSKPIPHFPLQDSLSTPTIAKPPASSTVASTTQAQPHAGQRPASSPFAVPFRRPPASPPKISSSPSTTKPQNGRQQQRPQQRHPLSAITLFHR